MKEIESIEPSSSIRLTDVVFALYRHRWLISFLTLAGAGAAVFLYLNEQPVYESTAKIYVRYVVENSAVDPMAGERRVSPDSRGEGVLGTEVQILTSWDLAKRVAANMVPSQPGVRQGVPSSVGSDTNMPPDGASTGAEQPAAATPAAGNALLGSLQDLRRTVRRWIQGQPEATTAPVDNQLRFAAQVRGGIRVEAPRRGSVMTVYWQSQSPNLPQAVLNQIIEVYLDRHGEVHRGSQELMTKFGELRQEEKDKMDIAETQIGTILRNLKVTSLGEAKSALNSELLRVREALIGSQADLAAQRARLEVLGQAQPRRNQAAGETNELAQVELPPREAIQEYRELAERIARLRRNVNQLLGPFTDHSPLVIHLREQILQEEGVRARMEAEHPGLLQDPGSVAAVRGLSDEAAGGGSDLINDVIRSASLEARIANLEEQENTLLARLEQLQSQEQALETFGRQLQIARANYLHFEERIRRADFDRDLRGAMGEDGSPNVAIIQQPSPPVRNDTARMKKAGIALGGGFGLGILYALAVGLLLDQRLRKPSEVEIRAGLPVMLSIPNIRGLRRISVKMPLLPPPEHSGGGAGEVPLLTDLVANGKRRPKGETDTGLVRKSSPWRRDNPMRPYFEALRDRLMLLFQLRDMKHKPKLVAVAGCSEGAGATTMAAGLAAALSETGDGKVLLVDLNLGRGAVHPFLRGTPVQALNEFLEDGTVKEEDAKLVVVTKANGEEEPARVPSGRLHQLVPKMRASDFDYIIFDMPAISETSATVALAAAMDHVLVVVEGQRTSQGEVKRAVTMLRRYGASVSGVFNKSRLKGPEMAGGTGLRRGLIYKL
jgi:polysaccharide biosynthesis transport protein